MHKTAGSIVEWLLRFAAAGSVVMAILWVIGPNGTEVVTPDDVPGSEQVLGTYTLSRWSAIPSAPVRPTNTADVDALYELKVALGAIENGTAPDGYAEVTFGTGLQIVEPATGQRWAYVTLNAGAWLVIGVFWWLLAGITRTVDRRSPFTKANARRLSVVGALLLVGSVVYSIAEHLVLARMVETSTLHEKVDPLDYNFYSLPWATIAAGVVALAIGQVWRRGVRLEADVRGLV